MKGQDKIPEKQLNEVEIGTFQKKRKKEYQNNDCEGDPGSREKNEGKD